MVISAKCECGTVHKMPDHLAGAEVQCKQCGRIGVVPPEDGELLAPAGVGPRRSSRRSLARIAAGAIILCLALALAGYLAIQWLGRPQTAVAPQPAAGNTLPDADATPPTPASAKPSPPEARLETVAVIEDHADVKAGDKVVATVEKGRRFGVIERRGDLVEVQVCVGTDILRGTLPASAVKLLTDADVDIAAEWLKMAKDLDPKLDVAAYRAKLDALIDRVAAAAAAGKTPRDRARLIGVHLFEREGFSPHEGINTPERVLDLKQGDCSGFSFLYLCIGQRLRMPLCLVAAPVHAFVRYEDRSERFNIETTQKGRLHDTDDYLRESLGAQRFSQVGGTHLASLPVPSALGVLFFAWGAALWEMRKPAEACEKFAKAVEINPRCAEAYYNWGWALDEMGKLAEACDRYAKAVEINPRHAEAHYNWGNALQRMGKPAEACEKFAKAVEISPRLAEAYSNWGCALDDMGKRAEACEKFARAVEINPRLAEAYYNWGNALGRMGKPAEACEKFAKAVEINPRLAEAYAGWGWALGKMGKTAEAIEKLDKAVELDPALKPKVEELRKRILDAK